MWRSAKGGMDLERGNGVISKHFSRCAQKDSHLLYMTYTYTWYGRLAIACCDIGSMFPQRLVLGKNGALGLMHKQWTYCTMYVRI